MPKNVLITIYNFLIVPHFDYCSIVWGLMGKGLSEKVQKLQNRADMNAQVPEYISKMFIKSSDVHSYSLHHAQDSCFIP